MGKVEEGLKIYPYGVFSISDISRELEESDLVGTSLTGDELHDNYYLRLTGDNSIVSDAKVDVVMCFEEYVNEDFATCVVLNCLLKLKGTETHLILWKNMDVVIIDEYGGYTIADEIDGGIYLVNPDKYLEVSKKKAERESFFKERQAIKEKEESERFAIYKESVKRKQRIVMRKKSVSRKKVIVGYPLIRRGL